MEKIFHKCFKKIRIRSNKKIKESEVDKMLINKETLNFEIFETLIFEQIKRMANFETLKLSNKNCSRIIAVKDYV